MGKAVFTPLLVLLPLLLNVASVASISELLEAWVDNRLQYKTDDDNFTNTMVTAEQAWYITLSNQGTRRLDTPSVEITTRLGADAFPYLKPDGTTSAGDAFKHRWNMKDIPSHAVGSLWLGTTSTKVTEPGVDSQRSVTCTIDGKFLDCITTIKVTPRTRLHDLTASITAEEARHVKPLEIDVASCTPKPSWVTQPADAGWYVSEPTIHSQYTFSARVRTTLDLSLPKLVYKPRVVITATYQESKFSSVSSSGTLSDEALGNITIQARDTYNWLLTWRETRDLVHRTVSTEQDQLTDVISRNIETYRKGDVTLKILDENRKPLANATVNINQVQHDFLFGCSYPLERQLPQDATRFRELFSSLFNYLSTENHFKWGVLEPRQGTIDYGQIDRLISWAQSKGIKVLGHTLVWGNWPDGGSGVPSWIRERPRNEARQLMENRIKQIVSRYAGKIAVWSVLSEPIHVKWFDEHFGEDYIELSFKWAREADPKPKLLIDEYNILTYYRDMEKYLNIIRNLKSKSVPLDIVGTEEVDAFTWLSPGDIYRGLDEIAGPGYEIQVTQFTVHGAGQPIAGGFRTGVWNEQTQAEYFEMFYRTAFSHPKVKAITTWSFLDPGWRGTNCGIVRSDLTPKPAYEALNRLINREWRTSVTTKTDEKGMVQFRGFFGTYELATTIDGEKRTLTFHLGENETRSLELTATKAGLELKPSEFQRYVLPLGILSILIVSVSFVALRRNRSPKKTNS